MKRRSVRAVVWVLVLSLFLPAGIFAQDVTPPPLFRQEELAQMLAPVALYPDTLLVQVLMASTYPLEVVVADRWVKGNPGLAGDRLAAALEQKDWDASVKSLVNFPSVLAMMSERLDWTQRLGDAFLSQREQVMDTVQDLRERARAAGNLTTTAEQRVVVQDRTVIIEPASPSVIYVPVYNPTVVYGPWWYPAYPPFYYYPPGYVVGPGIFAFGAGFFVGAAWGYAWGGCNWYRRCIYVNPYQNWAVNRYINRNDHVKRVHGWDGGKGEWRHDPGHRRGVAYGDPAMRQHHGQAPRPAWDGRKGFGPGTPAPGGKGPAMTGTAGPERRSQPALGPGRVSSERRPGTVNLVRTAPHGQGTAPDRSGYAWKQRKDVPARAANRTVQQVRQAPVVTPAPAARQASSITARGPGIMSTSYRSATTMQPVAPSVGSRGGFPGRGAGGGFHGPSGGGAGRMGGRHS